MLGYLLVISCRVYLFIPVHTLNYSNLCQELILYSSFLFVLLFNNEFVSPFSPLTVTLLYISLYTDLLLHFSFCWICFSVLITVFFFLSFTWYVGFGLLCVDFDVLRFEYAFRLLIFLSLKRLFNFSVLLVNAIHVFYKNIYVVVC